jgi:hypothetical protein
MIAVAFIFGVVPVVSADPTGNYSGSGWSYSNGTLTVSTNEGTRGWRDVAGNTTFRGSDITAVIIENSVTIIEFAAFQETNITSVIIPDSVTEIKNQAFSNCKNLSSVTIGKSVTIIGNWAFSYTNITSITIPYGVKEIQSTAFQGSRLTSVTIPGSVVSAGGFRNIDTLTSVIIENGVTGIGANAFRENPNLTSVTIPDSVTSIGSLAFVFCTNLLNITIPDSVTSIGDGAFGGTAWFNAQPDGLIYIAKTAYEWKGTMPSDTSVTIKDGTERISGELFRNKPNLISVTIPESVTNIGWSAFRNCRNLESITFKSAKPPVFDTLVFNENTHDINVYVPKGARAVYQATRDIWNNIVFTGQFAIIAVDSEGNPVDDDPECPECNTDPCECIDAPDLCIECKKEICVCCLDCKKDPCECVVLCGLCGEDPCVCVPLTVIGNATAKITPNMMITVAGNTFLLDDPSKLTLKVEKKAPENTEAFFAALLEHLKEK